MPETVRGGPGLLHRPPGGTTGLTSDPTWGAVYLLLLEWICRTPSVLVNVRGDGRELSPPVQRQAAAAGLGEAPAATTTATVTAVAAGTTTITGSWWGNSITGTATITVMEADLVPAEVVG